MILKRRFRFEAAHRLPNYDGPCSRVHGHTYRLIVALESPVDPRTGMGIDFFEVDRTVRAAVLDQLDHRDANDVMENPTAENLTVWIWEQLKRSLPSIVEVELYETEESSVVYRGS